MLPAHRQPVQQDSGSRSSSTEDLALAVLSSTATTDAAYRRGGDDDHDDRHDATEPLLPRHRSTTSSISHSSLRWRRLTRLGGILVVSLAAIGLFVFLPQERRSVVAVPLVTTGKISDASNRVLLASSEKYLLDPASENNGVIPFPSVAYSALYRPPTLQHPLSTFNWPSLSCLDEWVSSSELCVNASRYWAGENAPKIDVVSSWVNGSSAEIMADWRKKVSDEVGRLEKVKRAHGETSRHLQKRAAGSSVVRHFREHDELRFSIRSILSSLPQSRLSTVHLIVSDTPAYSPFAPPVSPSANQTDLLTFDPLTTRFAQIPHWVNSSTLELARLCERKGLNEPKLRVHPTSEFFKTAISGLPAEEAGLEELAAVGWQEEVLPSFNSLAIESQFANLDNVSPTALYLNDDFFLMASLTSGDIDSPLSGSVFRMQRDLLVSGVAPEDAQHTNGDGEWRGLGYSAWLLDRRFGERKRPYLVHVAKTLPMPILKEMQQVFLTELTATAAAQFRGKGPTEVAMMFLLTHYVVEKHREALLWSFLVARSDPDRSGTYSPSERQALLAALGGFGYSQEIAAPFPLREPFSSLLSSTVLAGLPAPAQTTFEFSSRDGYAYLGLEDAPGFPAIRDSWPSFSPRDTPDADVASDVNPNEAEASSTMCTLDLLLCFGEAFLSTKSNSSFVVNEVFRRVAYDQPQCGDCLIALLLGKSGEKGLEAFLPSADTAQDASQEVQAEALALEGTRWEELDFSKGLDGPGSLRQRAATLIQRYAYTIGSSSASFQSIKYGGPVLSARLAALSSENPAFLALNDDIMVKGEAGLEDVDRRMKKWFEEEWPVIVEAVQYPKKATDSRHNEIVLAAIQSCF
ncbi:hypothetical protein JCM11641_002250 [Rhodosporidiobolus odoratus]